MKKVMIVALLLCAIGAHAQKTTLGVGDAAPAIKYSKWLKGTPVEAYRDDRVYVLEFWATWCGPCIAAMPHLSELSEKYKSNTTFIGVNVLEKVGDKPYESALPAVTKFVEGSGNRMTYDVIVDNNAQEMKNLWLEPSGTSAIPTTFVIRKGRIEWIGHPVYLDTVMEPIIAGTFDVAAFKKEYDKKHSVEMKQANEMRTAYEAVQNAAKEKDVAKAFRLIDEYTAKMPILKFVLKAEKFKILLDHVSEKAALQYADTLRQEGSQYDISLAAAIVEKDGLTKETYLFGANAFQKAAAASSYSALYAKAALSFKKAGSMKEAVQSMQQAVEASKKEVNDPKYGGRVFEHTIREYEGTLKEYQSSL